MSAWAGETLLATGLLIAIVLAVRLPVARLFGARAAYALWLAPLLRLVVSPLPAQSALPPVVIYTVPEADGASAAAAGTLGFSPAELLFEVWLAGAAGLLLFQAIVHRRFLARAIAEGRRLPTEATGPELIESRAVEGPIATGIFHKRIFVPAGFDERLTPEQHRLAIAHEQLHHRRGDLVALALSLVVLALHWFNPLAYIAHRLFRRDLEAACDAELVERLGPDAREDYARAIVGCAAAPVPQAICTLTTIDDLKRRLRMLHWNHGLMARVTGFSCAAALALGGLALASNARAQTAEPQVEKNRIEKVVHLESGKEGHAADGKIRTRAANCEGEKIEASATADQADKKQQTKIVLCGKKGATPAELANMVEQAAARIEAEGDLRDGNKAEVLAQLRAKAAELRAR